MQSSFSNFRITPVMTKVPGPDGLESWCVALAAWFIHFLMGGLGRISGVFFVELMDIFDTDRLQASVPFFAKPLTRSLSGPVVGIIGQKYGVRSTAILGGIIGATSIALCFYTYSILWLTIMWGILHGFGEALATTLPQVILGQHFKKHKTTASGMAFSGGCVGAFLLPFLVEYLLLSYSLGETFFILGGVTLNVIPAAMLLNKPSWRTPNSKKNIQIYANDNADKEANHETENYEENISSGSSEIKHIGSINRSKKHESCIIKNDNFRKNYLSKIHTFCCPKSTSIEENFSKYMIDIEFLRKNRNHVIKLLSKFSDSENNLVERSRDTGFYVNNLKELEELYDYVQEIKNKGCYSVVDVANFPLHAESKRYHRCKRVDVDEEIYISHEIDFSFKNSKPWKYLSQPLNKLLTENKNNVLEEFSKDEHKNITYILEQFFQMHNLLRDVECSEDLSPSVSSEGCPKGSVEKCEETAFKNSNTLAAHIKSAFRLHTNPLFLLICLSRTVHFLTFIPALTTTVDYCMDKGLLEEDGKYVIAALAAGDLIGRQCLGWFTDREYISLPRFMLIVTILQGACTCTLSFMQSKVILLFGNIILGIFLGALFVRHPVLISKYLGENELAVAMGCINFFSGFLGFLFPSYIGYFRDTVGAYDGMFYITGGIGVLTGLLWAFEPFLLKLSKCDKNIDVNIPP